MMDLKKIKRVVEMNTNVKDLSVRSRKQSLVDARTIYFVLAKRLTTFSYSIISELVNRDHSSVTHAINEIYSSWLLTPNYFKSQLQLIDAIEKQIMDIDSIDDSDTDLIKKVLHEYEIKLIIKNKIIDSLNDRIDFLDQRVKTLKKYEPIW